jgi:hypothetical protein
MLARELAIIVAISAALILIIIAPSRVATVDIIRSEGVAEPCVAVPESVLASAP